MFELLSQVLVGAVVVALVLLRSTRVRSVHPWRVWLFPALLAAFAVLELRREWTGVTSTWAGGGALVAAAAMGVAIGWWRASLVALTWSAESSRWMMQTSKAGAFVILAIFAVRQALRLFVETQPQVGHAFAMVVLDALLVFGLAMIVAHRLRVLVSCGFGAPPAAKPFTSE